MYIYTYIHANCLFIDLIDIIYLHDSLMVSVKRPAPRMSLDVPWKILGFFTFTGADIADIPSPPGTTPLTETVQMVAQNCKGLGQPLIGGKSTNQP